jgi:hypothetical protein
MQAKIKSHKQETVRSFDPRWVAFEHAMPISASDRKSADQAQLCWICNNYPEYAAMRAKQVEDIPMYWQVNSDPRPFSIFKS